MNVVISDTAEYGNYLFSHIAAPLLREHAKTLSKADIGEGLQNSSNGVDNVRLIQVNEAIRTHPIESVGKKLRGYMTDMKRIVENAQ